MQLSRNVMIAAGLLVAWLLLGFWFRLAAIDASTAKTASEITELQQRLDALDQRVAKLNDDLGAAAASMNEVRPELAQNVSEVKSLLEKTLPAMRADLDKLSAPQPGRR